MEEEEEEEEYCMHQIGIKRSLGRADCTKHHMHGAEKKNI